MAKSAKGESLPDISKLTGDSKKVKVDQSGVLNTKGGAGKKGEEEFNDFTFKEGTTPVVKL